MSRLPAQGEHCDRIVAALEAAGGVLGAHRLRRLVGDQHRHHARALRRLAAAGRVRLESGRWVLCGHSGAQSTTEDRDQLANGNGDAHTTPTMMVPIQAPMPLELVEALDARRHADNTSRAEQIRRACRAYLATDSQPERCPTTPTNPPSSKL